MATTEEIYVPLLDEGVEVQRPALALRVDHDTYVVLRSDDYDAADETWEFPPGSVVVVVEERASGRGKIRVAVRLAQVGRLTA